MESRAVDAHAFVVGPGHRDERAEREAALFALPVATIRRFGLIHVRARVSDAELDILARMLCVDPVHGWWERAEPADRARAGAGEFQLETGLRPGVTDREGAELVRAANEAGLVVDAATIGTRWIIGGELSDTELAVLSDRVLHNEVIERWARRAPGAGLRGERRRGSGGGHHRRTWTRRGRAGRR